MKPCRKSPRVALDILLNKYVDGTPYLCRSTDISEEGIYLGMLIEPEVEEEAAVGLQFQLPGTDEVIYAEGEVVRSQQRKRAEGVGVRFTHIARRHRQLIEHFIRRRLAASAA